MANQVVKCPFCSGDIEIETEWLELGLKGECPHCGKKFVLGEKAPEHKRTMVVRESSIAEVSVKNDVKRSTGTTTNRTGIAAIVVSSLALIFSVAAFVVAMKSEGLSRSSVKSQEADKAVPAVKNESAAQTSTDKRKTSRKRIVDRTFRVKVPRGSKLKPTIAPSLFNAEKPSEGAVFFAVVGIGDHGPIGVNSRYASSFRGVNVWGFLDDNGVWKFSEIMNGYARKDSDVGKRLLQFLKDGKRHTCFLHLKPAFYTKESNDYELVDFEEIDAEELE